MNYTQEVLGGAGLVCAMLVAGMAISYYRRGERWRRLALAAQEVKEFEAHPAVQRVTMMLEYPRRAIDLVVAGEESVPIFVDEDLVIRALEVGGAPYDMEFTLEETAIRDMFAIFLGHLARFENHIRAGLIEPEDLRFHLARPLKLIGGGRRRSSPVVAQFWRFALACGHDEAMALCERYERIGGGPARRSEPVASHV